MKAFNKDPEHSHPVPEIPESQTGGVTTELKAALVARPAQLGFEIWVWVEGLSFSVWFFRVFRPTQGLRNFRAFGA